MVRGREDAQFCAVRESCPDRLSIDNGTRGRNGSKCFHGKGKTWAHGL